MQTLYVAEAPSGVKLLRDDNGVVHVETEREDDLAGACWAMGWAHALDRGLQIVLMRVLGQGRACECLEDSDEMLEVDRFFRRMNWGGETQAQLDLLDDRSAKLLQRYCDGINARLMEKKPWELMLVGLRPEPWTPGDVIMISRMVGYLTLAQSQAEVERFFVEMVQGGVSDEKLVELFPHLEQSGFDRDLLEKVTLVDRIVPDALKWLSPAPRMMASNNWVVSAERSATGHALLANDPHLESNRLPNVWYEMVIKLGKEHWAAGAGMPGAPGILVGRTRDLAWGATYTFMDCVDSWVEHCRDGRYRRGDEWVQFEKRNEVIRRKKGSDVEMLLHENDHGTLEGDPNVEGHYLSTRWSSGRSGAGSIASMIGLLEATSVEEGMDLFGRLEVSFSWVLADREGHIGLQMSGLMPVRGAGDGFVPLPGWDPDNDWQGFVDPEQLPRCIDPDEGFVVTANQDLNHLGKAVPINMPMGDYRARRVEQLLADCEKVAPEDFHAMHMDVHSLQAELFMELLRPLLPDTDNGKLLRDWDLSYDPASRGASLFEDFYSALRREIFAPGGFGESVTEHLVCETGIFIDFYAFFDALMLSPESAWFDGRGRDEIWSAAFEKVDGTDPVPWGERNRITMTNMFFSGKLPAFLGFDKGPFALRGGRATPHQGQIYRSAGRVTSFAPSLRIIADMGEDALHTCLAGGPSDRRFSKWYDSDVSDWLAGRYKTLEP